MSKIFSPRPSAQVSTVDEAPEASKEEGSFNRRGLIKGALAGFLGLGGLSASLLSNLNGHSSLDGMQSEKLLSKPLSEVPFGLDLGHQIPELTLPDVNEAPLKLSSLFGEKIILVKFWASFCGPCREELPSIIKSINSHKFDVFYGSGGEFLGKGLDVLFVSVDDEIPAWKDAIAKEGLSNLGHHVIDEGWERIGESHDIAGVPDTFVLDRNGTILARYLRDPELEQMLATIARAK